MIESSEVMGTPVVGEEPVTSHPPLPHIAVHPSGQSRGRDLAVGLEGVTLALGGRPIWSASNLAIHAGEFIVVLGPNGAGKSSLLRLLLGLLHQSQGEVTIFGEAPRRGSPAIGYVPQRRTLEASLGVRGRDLVAMGVDGHRWGMRLPTSLMSPAAREARRTAERRVDEVIARVGASAYANRPIGELSGGERQRLLLAQALVGEPRLLLLDEPLASLDVRSQMATARLVAEVARASGITVLLVAHDVNPLLPVLDRALYIARGRVAIGAPDEVITTESLSALYDAPVEVVRDSRGRLFVVGLEDEGAHPHEGAEG